MAAPHYHSHVDDPHAVGRRLLEARLAAGLSQRALAFPGCSAAYISRLEAGERVPSLQLLRKLAQRLRADARCSQAAIILLTGDLRAGDRAPRHAYECLLLKPCTPAALLDEVRRLLPTGPARPEA